jgi:hypothetical protein
MRAIRVGSERLDEFLAFMVPATPFVQVIWRQVPYCEIPAEYTDADLL